MDVTATWTNSDVDLPRIDKEPSAQSLEHGLLPRPQVKEGGMDLVGRQLSQQFSLPARRNPVSQRSEVADGAPDLDIHPDGSIRGHRDQAMAARMG